VSIRCRRKGVTESDDAHICYLSGDDDINEALKEIESAKRGEETEGRLGSMFIADFKPASD
jgi:hypothetical protein